MANSYLFWAKRKLMTLSSALQKKWWNRAIRHALPRLQLETCNPSSFTAMFVFCSVLFFGFPFICWFWIEQAEYKIHLDRAWKQKSSDIRVANEGKEILFLCENIWMYLAAFLTNRLLKYKHCITGIFDTVIIKTLKNSPCLL